MQKRSSNIELELINENFKNNCNYRLFDCFDSTPIANYFEAIRKQRDLDINQTQLIQEILNSNVIKGIKISEILYFYSQIFLISDDVN